MPSDQTTGDSDLMETSGKFESSLYLSGVMRSNMDALAFLDRFEIVSEVTGYCRRARDRETEATVLVHALPASINWERSLEEASVVAQGEQEGTLYVVTPDQPHLVDLRARVEIQASGPRDPGEFTQMFRLPLDLAAKETPLQKAAATPEPGEFTKLFKAPPPAGPVAPIMAPAPSDGGEFTKLFQAAPPPSDPPPSGPPPSDPPPSDPPLATPSPAEFVPAEFDNFYASPYASGSESMLDALDSQTPSLAPEQPLSRDPGSFTRLFGAREQVPPAPPEPNAAGATSVFAVPQPAARPPRFNTPASGPSEYTRVFQRPAGESAPKPLSAGQPEPDAANKIQPPPLVMIALIVGGLLLLAILVVVFFAIRR